MYVGVMGCDINQVEKMEHNSYVLNRAQLVCVVCNCREGGKEGAGLKGFGEFWSFCDENFTVCFSLLDVNGVLFGKQEAGVKSRGCLLTVAFLRKCREWGFRIA